MERREMEDAGTKDLILTGSSMRWNSLVFIAAACICVPAWSQTKQTNTPVPIQQAAEKDDALSFFTRQQTESIRAARSAKVVLVPPSLTSEDIRSEDYSITDWGCTFVTTEPSRIADLANILKNSDLNADDRYPWPRPHQEILLTLDNGTEIKFLFSRRSATQNGIVIGGVSNTVSNKWKRIIGKGTLPRELFLWAMSIGEPVAKASILPRLCEDFLNNPAWRDYTYTRPPSK